MSEPCVPDDDEPAIVVRGLRVTLPNGRELLSDVNIEVHPGEIVVLVGGSGSGKSTLSRALIDPERLTGDGFGLNFDSLTLDRNDLGLVLQRGALFDHLDVAGNIELAIRSARRSANELHPGRAAKTFSASEWLNQVSLPSELLNAKPSSLSGGQAQRVAVARTLAANRTILFLDEPSVGLDPARVRELARVVHSQVRAHRLATVVVTHDIALAAGLGDRILFLDESRRTLVPLFASSWPGPLEDESVGADQRAGWLVKLEEEIVSKIVSSTGVSHAVASPVGWAARLRALIAGASATTLRPFEVGALCLLHFPRQLLSRTRDFLTIAHRTAMQTLVRPLPFYALVAGLIGYTILFVISKVGGAGVRPDALIRQIGGSYVLALGPPLSAILFVAASGAATNAWLGSATLTKQVDALRALGIKPESYLWAPTFIVVGLSYLVVAALVCAAMLVGGWLLANGLHVVDAANLLTADFLDPRPERRPQLWRAVFLVWIYAWGIASDVVAKGTAAKDSADAVTRSMTGSVVSCTLWVVAWELVTAVWLFR